MVTSKLRSCQWSETSAKQLFVIYNVTLFAQIWDKHQELFLQKGQVDLQKRVTFNWLKSALLQYNPLRFFARKKIKNNVSNDQKRKKCDGKL